ncbi:MAG: PadR family transcriptional regulator [Lachnospiraceae bacterium]|nr:PadR family transcriptional regulator [Lachnospiraceae bacterium]
MRDNVKGGALTEVTFYILLALYVPRHGYSIMQFIEDTTGGRLTLGAGTLYGALTSLTEKGWIAPYGTASGRKKEYLITTLGKHIAKTELLRLQQLLPVAEAIILQGGSSHE